MLDTEDEEGNPSAEACLVSETASRLEAGRKNVDKILRLHDYPITAFGARSSPVCPSRLCVRTASLLGVLPGSWCKTSAQDGDIVVELFFAVIPKRLVRSRASLFAIGRHGNRHAVGVHKILRIF